MPKRGPAPKVSQEEMYDLLLTGTRPVWSVSAISDEFGVTRPTVHKHLQKLEEEKPEVHTVKVGATTGYYIPGIRTRYQEDVTIEEVHRKSLKREFTDRFVGLLTAPWTAVHPADGPAEAGDKVQIRVEGIPGSWDPMITHTWENKREELIEDETGDDETQALISGELYSKPTVPIEHVDYPADYDLEENVGAEYKEIEGKNRRVLIAVGLKNYLIKPCDEAVFLKDVSVDWISPKGEGQEVETVEITEEMIEDIGVWEQEGSDQLEAEGEANEQ